MTERTTAIQKELIEICNGIDAFFSGVLKKWDLTGNSFKVLDLLAQTPEGMEPAKIAESLGWIKQTVTPILNGLEKRGFLLRREQRTDHRRKKILLSGKGKAFAAEVCRDMNAIDGRGLSCFTEEEQFLFLSLFRRYFEAVRGTGFRPGRAALEILPSSRSSAEN